MGRISESIDIDAPLEVCWAINADARLTEHCPSIGILREVPRRSSNQKRPTCGQAARSIWPFAAASFERSSATAMCGDSC